MNDVMQSLIEKFNKETGKDAAKFAGDDGDSFRIEFAEEKNAEEFGRFIEKATKKSVIIQPIQNLFGKTHLARIFFEKTEATEIIGILKRYEEGTPIRELQDCPDGCSSHR